MKISKILKRSLFVFIALLVLAIGSLFAIPYFFKDELVELLKEEINANVNAEINFDNDISLSLIRQFPDFSLGINNLSLVGKNEFAGIELAKIGYTGLTLDLMTVLKSGQPIAIKAVNLDNAKLNIFISKEGKMNYDIALPGNDSITTTYIIELESYEITNSELVYDDRSSSTYIKATNIQHSGSGNFTESIYDLKTRSEIGALTLSSGGLPILISVKTTGLVNIEINNPESKYTLRDNDLLLNALKVKADGWVQLDGNDILMDLDFKAPGTDFKNLLSVIPSAYTKDFNKVKAGGNMAFSGNVKGKYNEKNMPAFNVSLKVDGGNFQYPDLPMGVSKINADVKVNSPASNLDKMTVDIPKLQMQIGNNPFDASIAIKNPITDPDIQAKVIGDINLEELAKAFPFQDIEGLSGMIKANLDLDTRMSDVENRNYDKVKLLGDLQFNGVNFRQKGSPTVKIEAMNMAFSPQFVDLKSLKANVGKSDVEVSGRLDNILAIFSKDLSLEGSIKLKSNLLDVNEWLPASVQVKEASPATTAQSPEEPFTRFDLNLDAQINKILYEDYVLEGTTLKGKISPERMIIDQMDSRLENSDFRVSGRVDNVYGYLFGDQILKGNLIVRSNKLDMNELYATTAEPVASNAGGSDSGKETSVYPVPANMDLRLDLQVGELVYTDMNFTKMDGIVSVRNSRASVEQFRGKGFGGDFALTGFYDTTDPKHPAFDLSYDLQRLGIQKTIDKLVSIKQLAPLTRYIEGLFSTKMKFSGNLKQDMSIDYNTLSAEGMFETFNSIIKNVIPFENLADKLGLIELNNIKVTDTKNWFNVKDGKFILLPGDVKFNEFLVNVSGSHAINNQSMDYLLKFDIPKEKLKQGAVGGAVSKGFSLLNEQANKVGINLDEGDRIKFSVNISGSLTKPEIKINLLGTDKNTLKDEVVAKLKAEAESKLTGEIKDKTGLDGENLKEVADDAKNKAEEKAKEIIKEKTDEVTEKAKEEVSKAIGEETEKVIENTAEKVLGPGAKSNLDSLKNKIKLPPLGKKKEKDGGN